MKTLLLLFTGLFGLTNLLPVQPPIDFAVDTITLDGNPLTTDTFSLNTSGTLVVVENSPYRPKSVPFRATLRRASTDVQTWSAYSEKETYSFRLGALWSVAQLGDELVIESVDQRVRRAVRIAGFRWLPGQEGC